MKIGRIEKTITTRLNGTLEELTPKGVSPLGTLLFQEVRFPAGTYTNPAGDVLNYSALILNHCKLSFFQEKIITAKNVNGLNGSIKQFISQSDTAIQLTGRLVSGLQLLYPKDKVIQLSDIFQVNASLPIFNTFLNNNLNIRNVVIKSIGWGEAQDYRDVPISIGMVSDFEDLENFENFVLK